MFKLELKKIKVNQAFSRETFCFTAELWFNDKKVGLLENDGKGGADALYPAGEGAPHRIALQDALLQIDAEFAKKPKIFGEWDKAKEYPMDYTLETWAAEQVDLEIKRKTLRNLLKKKVLFRNYSGLFTCNVPKGATIEQAIGFVSKKHPDAIILNRLVEDEALAIFKECA